MFKGSCKDCLRDSARVQGFGVGVVLLLLSRLILITSTTTSTTTTTTTTTATATTATATTATSSSPAAAAHIATALQDRASSRCHATGASRASIRFGIPETTFPETPISLN